MVAGKRGIESYLYIIISLILGLIILGVGLFFFFHEYFTQDDLDRETCRQSILLRANVPEVEIRLIERDVTKFIDSFPLTCRTEVISIEEQDLEEVGTIINDALASCWALYGNGDLAVFPGEVFTDTSVCVPCSRIHLTEEVKEAIRNRPIHIRTMLDDPMTSEYSYYQYLRDSGRQFPAFQPGSATSPVQPFDPIEFIFEKETFSIDSRSIPARFTNRFDLSTALFNIRNVYLPTTLNPDNGDLLIGYGVSIGGGELPNIPYLFFFQLDQSQDPLEEVSNKPFIGNLPFCKSWEGIPA